MKSKEIIYEVLFNKTKKTVISLNKRDLLEDYKFYVDIKKRVGTNKIVNLRTYVLGRIQDIIASTFIQY
jgi:hypothetical protein